MKIVAHLSRSNRIFSFVKLIREMIARLLNISPDEIAIERFENPDEIVGRISSLSSGEIFVGCVWDMTWRRNMSKSLEWAEKHLPPLVENLPPKTAAIIVDYDNLGDDVILSRLFNERGINAVVIDTIETSHDKLELIVRQILETIQVLPQDPSIP